ncbi:MAG: DUF2291 domain-containing protein [Acetobacteraceae bacterium]|nr:DUF2291 domain-containing protein [Acetobacteraceae bacterium]
MRASFTVGAIAATVSLSLGGCKIEKTVVASGPASSTSVFINDASFNPDTLVAEDWDAKLVPGLRAKAGPYDEVAAAIANNPDAAGERYGFREQQTGAPWTYAATVEGVVISANTASRAGAIEVRTDGGNTVTLQIGPVLRGTALRDSDPARPFSSFRNQVDYAQFARALNARANADALAKMPRDKLLGSHVSALGVFQPDPGNHSPLVTPVAITVEPKT